MAERWFTVEEARAEMAELLPVADELVEVRAELTVGAADLQAGAEVNLADLKGLEARLANLVDVFTQHGLQVKGWAPLLVDFPARLDGREVLLCWLEGERRLEWFHDFEHGFPGRRRLPT